MPVAKYQPPVNIPELAGVPLEQQAQLRLFLQRQFLQIAEDLASVSRNDAPTIVFADTRLEVPAGAKRRVSPTAAGMTVVLEAPSQFNAGEEIVLFVERPLGPLTVVSSPGIDDGGKVFLPLVNGAAQATYTAAGVVTLRSNGSNAWSSTAEIPKESPASPAAVAAAIPGTPGATGATGARGVQGIAGAEGQIGQDGQDGAQGVPGVPGIQGIPGAQGIPGRDGENGNDGADGAAGFPGSAGATGATGIQGVQGIPGADGQDGQDGRDGVDGFGLPGLPGAAGSNGFPGMPGIQGQDGENGSDGIGMPGVPGVQGVQGIPGVTPPPAGIVLSATNQSLQFVTATTALTHYEFSWNDLAAGVTTPNSNTGSVGTATTTANAVPAPSASAQRTIVEATISNVDATSFQIITVQELVGGTTFNLITSINLGPSERIEFTSDRGWRVFDASGAEKKPGGAAVALFQPGTVLGLNVDAASAGPGILLTGAQQGENVRFATISNDSTSTGVLLDYVINDPTTSVKFTAPGDITLRSVNITSATGGKIILGSLGAGVSMLVKHEDTGAGASARRISCPGGEDFKLNPFDKFILWRDSATLNRTQFLPFSRFQQADATTFDVSDDFTGGRDDDAGAIGETGWGIVSSVDAGSSVQQTAGEPGHPGVYLITGSASGTFAGVAIQKGGAKSGTSEKSTCPGDVDAIEVCLKTGPSITAVGISAGLVDTPITLGSSVGTAKCALINLDPVVNGNSNWWLVVRNSATVTAVDTGVTAAVSTWYYFLLTHVGTTWSLRVGASGSLSSAVTASTNAPSNTSPLYQAVLLNKQGTAGAHSMKIDKFRIRGTVARF